MAQAFNMGLERYDMSGKREALMLCVKEGNDGAVGDLQIMETFFNDFGFVPEIVIDGSVQEMRDKLRSFRDRINRSHEDISCVFVVTSSHGNRNVIIDPWENTLEVDEIIHCFNDQQCPKLRGKPKVFMLDACRGHMEDPGVCADKERDYHLMAQLSAQMETYGHRAYMNKFRSPLIPHMFVAYPTKPDFVAWMTNAGSHMFVKLAEVLASADTENEHLRDLFVKVNKKMVDEDTYTENGIRKTVMTVESTLTKALYLGRRRCSGFGDMYASQLPSLMSEFFSPTFFDFPFRF
ncbi:caspase-14-like [Epinephelus lanceolatus]|uniref:caspase-14-like n=1 Tax=Epinephelus lanceolatus TaxID=310571 RepID=UPI001445511E|nr:caspase-14-like [Epinephelus lanceolatus]